MNLEQGRPTSTRIWVVISLTVISGILYFHRFAIGYAKPFVQQEFGLSSAQVEWITTSFFLAYAIAQVPSGWLGDRFGPWRTLVICCLAWSTVTGLIGLAWQFSVVITLRALMGVLQAGAYPASAAILSRWIPVTRRATASAWVGFGGRFALFVGPSLTALMIVWLVPVSHPSSLIVEEFRGPLEKQIFSVLKEALDNPELPKHQNQKWVFDQLSPLVQQQIIESYTSLPPDINPDSVHLQILPGLVSDLNRLIGSSTFNPREAPSREIRWETEGKVLLARENDSTTGKKGPLSAAERQRLNRLFLEATFSDAIPKIYLVGWRGMMWGYAILGIGLTLLCLVFVAETPQQHPGCNEAELALIESGRMTPSSSQESFPWREVLRHRGLWMDACVQFSTNIGWLFVAQYFIDYLEKIHKVGLVDRGKMNTIALVTGLFGVYLGGLFCDFCMRKLPRRWGLAVPMGASRLLASLAYFIAIFIEDPWVMTVLMSMVALGTDLGVSAVWRFKQDIGGKYVGAILGWGNMWGNLGAALAPVVFTQFLGKSPTESHYSTLFLFLGFTFLCSSLCGFFVDSSEPLKKS